MVVDRWVRLPPLALGRRLLCSKLVMLLLPSDGQLPPRMALACRLPRMLHQHRRGGRRLSMLSSIRPAPWPALARCLLALLLRLVPSCRGQLPNLALAGRLVPLLPRLPRCRRQLRLVRLRLLRLVGLPRRA